LDNAYFVSPVSAPMADKAKVKPSKLLVIGLLIFVFAALFFIFVLGRRYWLIALGSGLVVAAIVTGINLLANHFRDNGEV
jgi:hypothetical protein